MQLDWSQISVGAVLGGIGGWFSSVFKSGLDHWFSERREKASEERVIRAEQRQLERVAQERQDAAKGITQNSEAELLMIVTRLNGCTDFVAGAEAIGDIHHFFKRKPEYLLYQPNRTFLEKYPINLRDRACFAPRDNDDTVGLSMLKGAAGTLRITQANSSRAGD
jgi:hypothetical protein